LYEAPADRPFQRSKRTSDASRTDRCRTRVIPADKSVVRRSTSREPHALGRGQLAQPNSGSRLESNKKTVSFGSALHKATSREQPAIAYDWKQLVAESNAVHHRSDYDSTEASYQAKSVSEASADRMTGRNKVAEPIHVPIDVYKPSWVPLSGGGRRDSSLLARRPGLQHEPYKTQHASFRTPVFTDDTFVQEKLWRPTVGKFPAPDKHSPEEDKLRAGCCNPDGIEKLQAHYKARNQRFRVAQFEKRAAKIAAKSGPHETETHEEIYAAYLRAHIV